MKPLKFGIIGCGSISKKHMKAAACNREYLALAAVSDINVKNALSLGTAYRQLTGNSLNAAVYSDYRQMIEREKLDVVSILTDSGTHFAIALECIEKGINVLVEKPVSLSLQNMDTLIEAAELYDVKLGAVHQHRFNPLITKLKDQIDRGCLGNLFYGAATIRWNRSEEYYKEAEWRGTMGQDGGILMNQCIHNIDLLQWLLDVEAVEVFAYEHNFAHPYIETGDTVLALIKFNGGMLGSIEGTVASYPHNLESSISVFGERGSVKIGGPSLNRIEMWQSEEKPDISIPNNHAVINSLYHEYVYRDFAESVVTSKKPMVDGREARKSIELILAIQQSAEEGAPVRLPL